MTRRAVVLDCDTGTDDAVAIMLAALHPGLDLLGVTSVWGNVTVEHTTDNALRVLDHVGRHDVPVLRGADRPLGQAPDAAARARRLPPHLPLPPSSRAPAGDAVEWLVETLRATTRPVTLVATGPLTNVALAVAAAPTVVGAVAEVVLMGGGHARSNVTPSAERNVWWDAPAAQRVLQAGFERLVMVTLDATDQARATADDTARWRALGTPAGTATATLVEERLVQYGGPAPLHDPLTVAYLLDPEVVTLRHAHVAVETAGALTYGRTVIDLERVDGRPPNAHVALEVDVDRYFGLLSAAFG
ncbi:nucleoside hydrolase [Nocardioides iriomotensis]|uniref:Nucleoside hydrolase n=1 Tax=Nocardioides iriomotensis TaxID=715784 RepID=A0A4Q5J758_9ACTN|nr:nucleoside hydrolase [Nocardioides iriomotensis]RYU13495.1 nucleoside hydrolase [Nocardioides iriomotensis]